MIRGIMKSTSVAALVAACAFANSASAADLGGNCCADLEERVAELEATVAKKGTRKVSLTVYGWVNKTMMHFDDGVQSNNYLGIDNTNSATRFGFRGDAAINSEWKAGYNILLDVFTGATSSRANQFSEDGSAVFLTGPANGGATGTTADDYLIRMRDANLWLESSRIGRVTMGRLTQTGAQGTIDLGGIANIASSSFSLLGGGLFFRDAAGALTTNTISNNSDSAGDYNARVDGLRWDSPTWHGFVIGASVGEAREVDRTLHASGTNVSTTIKDGTLGLAYALNLRYAGEFNGVRVASAIGYEVSRNEEGLTSASTGTITIPGGAAPGIAAQGSNDRSDSKNFGVSLSLMHVASGLFAQGHYLTQERGNNGPLTTPTAGPGGSDKAKNFLIQAGIARNWFGIGNTALYGEYGNVKNGAATFGQTALGGARSDLDVWGLGMTQNIDAAAMQLYAGYRNYSLDHTAPTGAVTTFKDIGVFAAGARINF